jgi:hypothetical protein
VPFASTLPLLIKKCAVTGNAKGFITSAQRVNLAQGLVVKYLVDESQNFTSKRRLVSVGFASASAVELYHSLGMAAVGLSVPVARR